MSTEPKLGTCDNIKQPHSYLDGTHMWLTGTKRNVCVNWREGESAVAQAPTDPSPTPWDYSTWGFYCDACKTFFDLLTDGLIGTTRYHRCGSQARYIGYDHAAFPPAQPCINCGQPESDKAHDPDCPSIIDRHKFEAVPPAAETAAHISLSRSGLRIVGEQLDRIPFKNAEGWNRYNTDCQRVLHIWADGKSYDIMVPKEEFLGDE